MTVILIGMILDFVIGDPMGWPHPVIGIGRLISWLEKRLYAMRNKRLAGGLLVAGILGTVALVILWIRYLLHWNPAALMVFDVLAIFAGLAFRSLMKASKSVSDELVSGDLEQARKKVGMFVSRETEKLTEDQVVKTVIETVSENTVDGILSPLFYCVVGQLLFRQGVLFLWLYKAINTMDSMVAYKNERYMEFGFVAAKVDDVANWLPARLSGVMLLVAGGMCGMDVRNGWKTLLRDSGNSVSPNAGYPESVAAGLTGIRLGGDYPYFGKMVRKPLIGEAIETPEVGHIRKVERLVLVNHMLVFAGLLLFVLGRSVI